MKTLLLVLLFLGITSCCKDPPLPQCKPYTNQDLADQIKSKDLGTVTIDGETCHIYEQYHSWNCHEIDGERAYQESELCVGRSYTCRWQVLTRVTKCPTKTYTNGVTQTGGKFSHEEVH